MKIKAWAAQASFLRASSPLVSSPLASLEEESPEAVLILQVFSEQLQPSFGLLLASFSNLPS